MNYTAFGITIHSAIKLPPLQPVTLLNTDSCDVQIELGRVDKSEFMQSEKNGFYTQSAPDQLRFHIPDIAWFQISAGNKVVIEPDNNSDEDSIRIYLLGTCLGIIMHQRNHLVIHGNAVRFDDHCVIFAGKSGNGKSTLAAAFLQRGRQLLADDLAVINAKCEVLPSYPQIKLWHDTAEKLNIDISTLTRIRLQIDKYAYPIQDSFCNIPLPVKAIYILNHHNQDDFIFESINGINKFNPLKNHTYRINHLDGLGLKAQHLKLCSQLANQIEVTRITRPNAKFQLDKLVDLIEADLATTKAGKDTNTAA
jgi:hypothetical protein